MYKNSASCTHISDSHGHAASDATSTHLQAEQNELAVSSAELNALDIASEQRRARLADLLVGVELPSSAEMRKIGELARSLSAKLDSTEVMVARHKAWMSSTSESTTSSATTGLYDDALSPPSSNVSSQSSVGSHSPDVAYEPPTQRRRLDDGSTFF
jgi:hypothetical protein